MMEISAQAPLISFYPNAINFFSSAIKMYLANTFHFYLADLTKLTQKTHLLTDILNR